MVKAIRKDANELTHFADAARARGDGLYLEKCPRCDVEYDIFVSISDDVETLVNAFGNALSKTVQAIRMRTRFRRPHQRGGLLPEFRSELPDSSPLS